MPVLHRDNLTAPRAATELIEAFESAHPGSQARLWARRDERWSCIVPDEERDLAPDTQLHAVAADEGLRYALEVEGATPSETGFLAEAVGRLFAYEREARSAARELTERYEEINLLYSISEILGSVLSVDEASSRIVAEVADVMGARRASLWVHDHLDETLRLAAAVGDDGMSGPIATADPHSVTARVFRERQSLNLERNDVASWEGRLEPRPHGREAFLSVPINYTPPEGESRTVGVVTLVGGKNQERFSAGDMRLLTAIASQVGAALEMQRLVQDSLRQERMVRELELAHDLQLKLLPSGEQLVGVAEVAARCVPAESVGGDFYHLFRLSRDRVGIMIGDVSGHGFSAALIMALTMSAVAISAEEAGPPAELLRRVHSAIISELEQTEMYITLFYCVLDPATGTLVYANAGHPHAFVVHAGSTQRLLATNPPLGMMPLGEYSEAVVEWNSAEDLLCLFTDGLSEAFGGDAGSGGEARLVEEVLQRRGESTKEILAYLFDTTDRARLNIAADDRTAVLVRV